MNRRFGYTLVLLAVAACGGQRDGAFRPIAVGDIMPTYGVRTLSGDSVQIGAGEPVTLLNVWATWCTSCEEEMADLVALQRDLAPSGARIVGVSVDAGDPSRVRRFAEEQRLNFPVALDREQRVKRLFRVVGVPTTFVIGRDGRLLLQHVGNLHPLRDSVAAVIRAAQGS
jgi:peroxiredoxin